MFSFSVLLSWKLVLRSNFKVFLATSKTLLWISWHTPRTILLDNKFRFALKRDILRDHTGMYGTRVFIFPSLTVKSEVRTSTRGAAHLQTLRYSWFVVLDNLTLIVFTGRLSAIESISVLENRLLACSGDLRACWTWLITTKKRVLSAMVTALETCWMITQQITPRFLYGHPEYYQ